MYQNNIELIETSNSELDNNITSRNSNKSNKNIKFIKQFKCKNVYITGFLCGIIALLLNTIVLYIFSYLFNNSEDVSDDIKKSFKKSPITLITGMCIIGPVIEELIFRRIIFYFISKWNLIAGYLVSSFLYSSYHFGYLNFSLIIDYWDRFIIWFIIGILFAYSYDRDRCILSSIISHIIHNSIILLLSLLN
ncbi:hypothetical protein BCR36DRAFT_361987 [Piromyces finnis]|uniref:CAAX prenyl protease 2/Lysostaphin resistance protein A-like domain-containing protein n=1 Tax=Piromyces finnis TaxID=1754191 RepID=A0A1Y1UX12_9FUNG|nr:hypothetical protein BCR36DRAFT_361987 [Piromyces finnis]|eukprot:ORX42750.1 hypothetical protein BCR36DRAFT_361987 [Piromyces finnis]